MANNCSVAGQSLLPYGSLQGNVCVCSAGHFLQNAACVPYPSNNLIAGQSTSFFQPKLTTSSRSDVYGVQRRFLWVTSITIGAWLLFCGILRLFPLKGLAFSLRYYISRLDYRFWRRHWLDEQKVQVKKKTELGGAFSVASYMFLIGLGASFVYEQVAHASITQETVIPSQLSDLMLFKNDIEFSITTVSNMQCAQFVANSTARTGVLSKLSRTTSLADLATTMECRDTPKGPLVRIACNNCSNFLDNTIFSFKFVDMPGSPALATGFEFFATSSVPGHRSVASGVLEAGADGLGVARNASLRGESTSVLNFRLVPRLFKSEGNLRLMQATFHQYTSGSSVSDDTSLAKSLASPGEVRVAVWNQVLSSYIVESEKQKISNLVTFIAKIGGIYGLSVSIFYFIMYELEYHIKFFRHEDRTLHALHARHMANRRWRTLRLYVRHLVDWNLVRSLQGLGPPGCPPGDASSANKGGDSRASGSTSRRSSSAPLLGGPSSIDGDVLRAWHELGVLPLASKKHLEASAKHLHPPTRLSLRRLRRSAMAVQAVRDKKNKNENNPTPLVHHNSNRMLENLMHSAKALSGPVNNALGHAVAIPANALTSVLDHAVATCEDVTGIDLPHIHLPGSNHMHSHDGQPILLRKRKRVLTGSGSSHKGSVVRQFKKPSWLASDIPLPSVPVVEEEEEEEGSSVCEKEPDVDAMYAYLQDLIAYDKRLRNDFLGFQSMLENVVQRFRPHSNL